MIKITALTVANATTMRIMAAPVRLWFMISDPASREMRPVRGEKLPTGSGFSARQAAFDKKRKLSGRRKISLTSPAVARQRRRLGAENVEAEALHSREGTGATRGPQNFSSASAKIFSVYRIGRITIMALAGP
jgi:hypothetical protein